MTAIQQSSRRSLFLASAALLAACSTPTTGTASGGATANSPTTSGVPALKPVATIPTAKGPHGIDVAGDLVFNADPSAGKMEVINAQFDVTAADAGSLAVLETLDFTRLFPGSSAATVSARPSATKADPAQRVVIALDGLANGLRIISPTTRGQVAFVAMEGKPGSRLGFWDTRTAMLQQASVPNSLFRVRWPLVAGVADFAAIPSTRSFDLAPVATGSAGGFIAVGKAFVAAPSGPDHAVVVSALDPADGEPVGEKWILKEGNEPGPIEMGLVEGKDRLVYGNKTSNTLVVYDPSTKTVVAKPTTLSTPTDSVLTADKAKAFITCKGADRVAVVDLATGKILTHVLVGRKLDDKPTAPVHIYRVPSPDAAAADQIWVMGDGDDSVTVMDAVSYKVLHVIQVGVGHHKAAFTATRAFVSNITDNTISVIDRTQVK
ncbi:MAG: hypothetical protein FJY99_00670 [Candidatus Sericytochromatia bacterium]|nr:hypothetical protein [Candidatus Tanganyikabacteria bacterium]